MAECGCVCEHESQRRRDRVARVAYERTLQRLDIPADDLTDLSFVQVFSRMLVPILDRLDALEQPDG